MARILTDGEREIVTELNADAWEPQEGSELSGEWCYGCDNPREECHCRPVGAPGRAARRETAKRALHKALELRPVVLRVDNDFFAVASSEPGHGYLLERDPATGDLYCPCLASEYGMACYHRAALGLFLGTIPASWLPGTGYPLGDDDHARRAS